MTHREVHVDEGHIDLGIDVPPPEEGGPPEGLIGEAGDRITERAKELAEEMKGDAVADHWETYIDSQVEAAAWLLVLISQNPGPGAPWDLLESLARRIVLARTAETGGVEP